MWSRKRTDAGQKNSERELAFNHAFLSTVVYLIIERTFGWGMKKNSIRHTARILDTPGVRHQEIQLSDLVS